MEAHTRGNNLVFPCPQNASSMETTVHTPDACLCGRHSPLLNESPLESSRLYVLK